VVLGRLIGVQTLEPFIIHIFSETSQILPFFNERQTKKGNKKKFQELDTEESRNRNSGRSSHGYQQNPSNLPPTRGLNILESPFQALSCEGNIEIMEQQISAGGLQQDRRISAIVNQMSNENQASMIRHFGSEGWENPILKKEAQTF
jgi:hypothetical protein